MKATANELLTGLVFEVVKGKEELDKIDSETTEEFNARVAAKTAEIFPDEYMEKMKQETSDLIHSIFSNL